MRRRILPFLLFLGHVAYAVPAEPLHTAREVNDFLEHGRGKTNFAISVQVISDSRGKLLFVEDGTGRLALANTQPLARVASGDLLRVQGFASVNPNGETWLEPEQMTRTGTAPVSAPAELRLSALDRSENAYRRARITGRVYDIAPDEFDDSYCDVTLYDDGTMLPVVMSRNDAVAARIEPDATIRLTGRYCRSTNGVRKYAGPCVIHDAGTPVEILAPPPDNPFEAPTLERRFYRTPDEIARLGPRTISGRVIAAWGDGNLMVREEDGRIVNVSMMEGQDNPSLGETGVFVGYPYSDLMRINLARARFLSRGPAGTDDDTPWIVTPEKLIADRWITSNGKTSSTYHGKLLRLTGTIRSLPLPQSPEQRIYLDCGAHVVPIDISACRDIVSSLPLGAEIEVTGRCLLETENGRANNLFRHVRGFALIVRTAADLRLTKTPSWWTPARLMAVIGFILAGLLVSFVWVFSLHRLAERRGRALFQAREAREEERHTRHLAELRMQERTRLAIELHDTISQNLTGATMQMGTASQLVETDRVQAIRHLDLATRTLDSCREELRNCIWDLRNNALDLPDLNEAIRMTLRRLMGGVTLQLRFNIPREQLSDNTAHALMRIVRELATNAVRHGKARTIRIAGVLADGFLRFSVTDDGTGFDPQVRPGLAEGHFGLQGVEERADELGGGMKITSRPGTGTRVSVWIKSRC